MGCSVGGELSPWGPGWGGGERRGELFCAKAQLALRLTHDWKKQQPDPYTEGTGQRGQTLCWTVRGSMHPWLRAHIEKQKKHGVELDVCKGSRTCCERGPETRQRVGKSGYGRIP